MSITTWGWGGGVGTSSGSSGGHPGGCSRMMTATPTIMELLSADDLDVRIFTAVGASFVPKMLDAAGPSVRLVSASDVRPRMIDSKVGD